MAKYSKKAQDKIEKVMHEFKHTHTRKQINPGIK